MVGPPGQIFPGKSVSAGFSATPGLEFLSFTAVEFVKSPIREMEEDAYALGGHRFQPI